MRGHCCHPQGCCPCWAVRGGGDRWMSLLPAAVKQKFILSPGQVLTRQAENGTTTQGL